MRAAANAAGVAILLCGELPNQLLFCGVLLPDSEVVLNQLCAPPRPPRFGVITGARCIASLFRCASFFGEFLSLFKFLLSAPGVKIPISGSCTDWTGRKVLDRCDWTCGEPPGPYQGIHSAMISQQQFRGVSGTGTLGSSEQTHKHLAQSKETYSLTGDVTLADVRR